MTSISAIMRLLLLLLDRPLEWLAVLLFLWLCPHCRFDTVDSSFSLQIPPRSIKA